MHSHQTPGEIKTGVTAIDQANIAELIEDYKHYEGVDFPVALEEMLAPSENKPTLLLHYQADTLTGFAYLQHGSEIEIYGMVHPEHRRQGVGTALLHAAQAVQRQEGTETLLLVCDSALASGKAFAEAVGGEYRFSEHHMVLDPNSIKRPQVSQGQQVQFRRAEATELPILTQLVTRAFDDPEEETASRLATYMQADNQRFYIGLLDGQPIGVLRNASLGEQSYIATFGVLPPYRGHGYGRQMLLAIVDLLLAEHWADISLDVETKNANALGLYESCGFRTSRTYDYYRVTEE